MSKVEPIALIIQRTGNYAVHDTRERTRVATCVHELAVSSHCTLRRQNSRLFHAKLKFCRRRGHSLPAIS
jgi:hypothetical protein